MLRMKLLGMQNVDYTSKRTNQPVRGTSLHVAYESPDTIGFKTESIFVSNASEASRDLNGLSLDSYIGVCYNRYGRVESVVIAE